MRRQVYMTTAAVMAAMLFASACSKKNEPAPTASSQTETATEPAAKPSETETAQDQTEAPKESAQYHMLQGTITRAEEDGSVFTLQADDGKDYDIRLSDIRDVETQIAPDVQIAIAYIGDPLGDLEDVDLVVALPEQEEWTIITEEGTTTANAMSSFTMETADGRELSFIKDNCPIEDGALSSDSGDKVKVTYVTSDETNFPVEIRKGE